jgi:hypothetical protein
MTETNRHRPIALVSITCRTDAVATDREAALCDHRQKPS